MKSSPHTSVDKFDASCANEYGRQSRIALAGCATCQDLAACMLAASLGDQRSANILASAGDVIQPAVLLLAGQGMLIKAILRRLISFGVLRQSAGRLLPRAGTVCSSHQNPSLSPLFP